MMVVTFATDLHTHRETHNGTCHIACLMWQTHRTSNCLYSAKEPHCFVINFVACVLGKELQELLL